MTLAPDTREYYYEFCFFVSFAITALACLYFVTVRTPACPLCSVPWSHFRQFCRPESPSHRYATPSCGCWGQGFIRLMLVGKG